MHGDQQFLIRLFFILAVTVLSAMYFYSDHMETMHAKGFTWIPTIEGHWEKLNAEKTK